MAQKKQENWDQISSDEEEYQPPKQDQEQEDEEEQQQQQQQNQEQTEQQQQGEEGEEKKEQKHQKKILTRQDQIDLIKKIDGQNIAVSIFRAHPSTTIQEIYKKFQDVKINKIYQDRTKQGSFVAYFETKQNAIEFIRRAPRQIHEQNFHFCVNEKKSQNNNSGWNEVGAGGRTLHEENNYKKSYKTYDRPAKRTQKPYNRKEQGEQQVDQTSFLKRQSQGGEEQKENEQDQQQDQNKKSLQVTEEDKKRYQNKKYNNNNNQNQNNRKGSYNKNNQKRSYNSNRGDGEKSTEENKDYKPKFFNSKKGQQAPTNNNANTKSSENQQPKQQQPQKQEDDGWCKA